MFRDFLQEGFDKLQILRVNDKYRQVKSNRMEVSDICKAYLLQDVGNKKRKGAKK